MKITCIENRIASIPDEYLKLHIHQSTEPTDPLLTVGKEYTVFGIEIHDNVVIYWAELNHQTIGRTSSVLFSISSGILPDDWAIRVVENDSEKYLLLSFEDFFEDYFLDDYYNGKTKQVEILKSKLEKYNNLIGA